MSPLTGGRLFSDLFLDWDNCTRHESCVLKAIKGLDRHPKMDTPRLTLLIDISFDSYSTPHGHLSHLKVGWESTNFQLVHMSQLTFSQLLTYCWLSANQVSIEMLIKCWSRVNGVSNMMLITCQSRVFIKIRPWMPLAHMTGLIVFGTNLLPSQHCFFLPVPPNLIMSLQDLHFPQSGCWHTSHTPHLFLRGALVSFPSIWFLKKMSNMCRTRGVVVAWNISDSKFTSGQYALS